MMVTDWQLATAYEEGYLAGWNGKNEEFDNPYWQSNADSTEWLRGWAHGAQSCELFKTSIAASMDVRVRGLQRSEN